MGKAIEENKLTVIIKIILLKLNIFWKFMQAEKNNDNNKNNLPPPPLQLQFS